MCPCRYSAPLTQRAADLRRFRQYGVGYMPDPSAATAEHDAPPAPSTAWPTTGPYHTPPPVRTSPGNSSSIPSNLADSDFNNAWRNGFVGPAVNLSLNYVPTWAMTISTASGPLPPPRAPCRSFGVYLYTTPRSAVAAEQPRPRTMTLAIGVQYSTAPYNGHRQRWPAAQRTN